jgi:hypothetical protein
MSQLGSFTAETIALAKAALQKNVTISTGLTAYDLQAPAKNLYPQITPLRNRLPRIGRKNPGDAARWRVIPSITGSGYDAMGYVPEGQRSGSMSYAGVPKTAPYITIGEEDSITFEAESAAEGYEDINTTASLRVLQKMMLKEEFALLGGNASLALGTPSQASLSAAGTGATLPAATYSVMVVALTTQGFANMGSVTGQVGNSVAVPTTKTVTGNDGNTFVLAGGSSNKSASATQAVTLGQTLSASVSVVPGAVAYAWFIGTAGNETLQKVTTINSVTFSAPLTSGNQAATAISADNSTNSLGYDGLLSIAMNPTSGAYYNALSTGTAGTGSYLTPSGSGSILEIDTMLKSMWDTSRLSPSVMFVSSQEMQNIRNKVLSNASGPLLRIQTNTGGVQEMRAGSGVRFYYNPFQVTGGNELEIVVHPTMPPGTLMAYSEKLPEWYQRNEVVNTFEVMTRRDYYRMDWPLRTRRREFGVYAEEVLAAYTPFAIGVITNIANG